MLILVPDTNIGLNATTYHISVPNYPTADECGVK